VGTAHQSPIALKIGKEEGGRRKEERLIQGRSLWGTDNIALVIFAGFWGFLGIILFDKFGELWFGKRADRALSCSERNCGI